MIFLLDTNAFSDMIRDNHRIRANLEIASLNNDEVIICSIVRGEIFYGIERLPQGHRRRELEDKADNLFNIVECREVPQEAGDHYARIKAARQRYGLATGENDLWIAATALSFNATLVSRDSDFQQVDDLMVVDWAV